MEKNDKNGHTKSGLSAEYRFVHQRLQQHTGRQRFVMPVMLLVFELAFIVLFGLFANYQRDDIMNKNEDVMRIYPMFQDIHVFVILGIGFIMTFLKRYGYGSLGFNLLLSAFVMQWSLLVRGWIEWNVGKGQFMITIRELIVADFTTLSILISFGAVLGKTTSAQLVCMAVFGVLAQVVNEFINVQIFQAHDIGKGMYVHLFGAMFGLGVSKTLNFNLIRNNSKQKSVYHSDLFAFIGTLFLWVFFPSLNAVFAEAEGQTKAIVNTYLAITASTVVTVAISSLYGNGKINVMHVQHSTLAGGVAISVIADVNLQCYVSLIIGCIAGLMSTVGFHAITKSFFRIIRLHDTCGVFNLHGLPGILAGMSGSIFAAATMLGQYKNRLFHASEMMFSGNSSDTLVKDWTLNMTSGPIELLTGRTSGVQAGYQLAALAVTFAFSLFSGALVGFFLRLPIFDQLVDDIEMFDDELQWKTPDDYALKLTLAPSQNDQTDQDVETPLVQLKSMNNSN